MTDYEVIDNVELINLYRLKRKNYSYYEYYYTREFADKDYAIGDDTVEKISAVVINNFIYLVDKCISNIKNYSITETKQQALAKLTHLERNVLGV
jgi:hypothetical protein